MKRLLNLSVLSIFVLSNLYAQPLFAQINNLPQPGTMVGLSVQGNLPMLKGLRLNKDNPLVMDFIVEPNGAKAISKEDAAVLVKYFVAALAMPKQDTWVNLSPYEKERIVPNAMQETDLGKDLLEQDYILKQLAASLTHPGTPAGRAYWRDQQNLKSQISNLRSGEQGSLAKVWILPAKSSVYEKGDTVLISEATLAVKMEKDNPAFKTNILPLIEKDVNSGKNFANLRQIYSALILAEWFKGKFFESFYKNYINNAKTNGVTIDEKDAKEKIYNLYIEAFKKGSYNLTKSERTLNKIIKRNYFSGGVAAASLQVTKGPETAASSDAVSVRNAFGTIGRMARRNEHSVSLQVPQGARVTWLSSSKNQTAQELGLNTEESHGVIPELLIAEDDINGLPGVFSYYEAVPGANGAEAVLIVTQKGLTDKERREAVQRAYDAYESSKLEDVKLIAAWQAFEGLKETQPVLSQHSHGAYGCFDYLLHFSLVNGRSESSLGNYAVLINKSLGLDDNNATGHEVIQRFDAAYVAQLQRFSAMRAVMLANGRMEEPASLSALEEKEIRERTYPDYGLVVSDLNEEYRDLYETLLEGWFPNQVLYVAHARQHNAYFAKQAKIEVKHDYHRLDELNGIFSNFEQRLARCRELSTSRLYGKDYKVDPRQVLGDSVLNDFQVNVIENPFYEFWHGVSEAGKIKDEDKIMIWVDTKLSDEDKQKQIFYQLCRMEATYDPAHKQEVSQKAVGILRFRYPQLSDSQILRFRLMHESSDESLNATSFRIESIEEAYWTYTNYIYPEALSESATGYARRRYLERFGVEAPVVDDNAGSSSRGGLSPQEHADVNAVIEDAADSQRLYALRLGSRPLTLVEDKSLPVDQAVSQRIERIIGSLKGISLVYDQYRYPDIGNAYYNYDDQNLAAVLRETNIMLVHGRLDKQGHSGYQRVSVYLILQGGLEELAKMSDRELAEMLFEEVVEQRIRFIGEGSTRWTQRQAQAAHELARDLIVQNQDKLEQAVGGEDFRKLDVASSGRMDEMSLTGADFDAPNVLTVNIVSITPFKP